MAGVRCAGWKCTVRIGKCASCAKGGGAMNWTALPAPCRRCTRVTDPRKCENQKCTVWRSWFRESWGEIRAYPRRQMDTAKTLPLGVRIGGRYYLHPDHLRAHCKKDPCVGCESPCELCKTPCRMKKNWEQIRKENGYELEK